MGLMETIKYIYRSYGLVNGFYRGVSLNYVKAVPMVATSFCVFEMCKKTLFGLHTGVQVVWDSNRDILYNKNHVASFCFLSHNTLRVLKSSLFLVLD